MLDEMLKNVTMKEDLMGEIEIVIDKHLKNKPQNLQRDLLMFCASWLCMHVADLIIKDEYLNKKYELLSKLNASSQQMLKHRTNMRGIKN